MLCSSVTEYKINNSVLVDLIFVKCLADNVGNKNNDNVERNNLQCDKRNKEAVYNRTVVQNNNGRETG